MEIRQALLVGCAALAMSGCKEDVSDVSDDQLVALLGSEGAGNWPRQIVMQTRECVELLGGINNAVYKYLPGNLLGLVKDVCRDQFNRWLEDPERNTTDLKLADFEREALAARIIAVADAQEAALVAYRRAHNAFPPDDSR